MQFNMVASAVLWAAQSIFELPRKQIKTQATSQGSNPGPADWIGIWRTNILSTASTRPLSQRKSRVLNSRYQIPGSLLNYYGISRFLPISVITYGSTVLIKQQI